MRNTKQEILDHLREMLEMEGRALGMYVEMARAVRDSNLKAFFVDMSKEEKRHAEMVSDMIMLLEGSVQTAWHSPPPG